jgi:FKBP-type peptidyl-prolyl cis-trans isomerase (trigger factor)
VRYPADFPDEELRGREQRLRIRLNELSRRDLPAMDDAFRAVAGSSSRWTRCASASARPGGEKQRNSEAAMRAALVEQVLAANSFEVPPSMVDRYLAS